MFGGQYFVFAAWGLAPAAENDIYHFVRVGAVLTLDAGEYVKIALPPECE